MQYGITRHRVFPRNHADPGVLLEYAAKEADGIVIAGAGEFSKEYIQVIEKLTIPVVISSRIDDGIITQNVVLCDNPIAAYHLSAQKAAVLLRLSLTKTSAQNDLIDIFQNIDRRRINTLNGTHRSVSSIYICVSIEGFQ